MKVSRSELLNDFRFLGFIDLKNTVNRKINSKNRKSLRNKMLLAIDPGASCGWALFWYRPSPIGGKAPRTKKGQTPRNQNGQTPLNESVEKGQSYPNGILYACGLGQMPESWPEPITRIVVERPHTGRSRARAKDVITLAVRAGEVGGIWSYILGVPAEYIEPGRWKGSTSKKIGNEIVESKLSSQEAKIIDDLKLSKTAKHNVLDAVGIGLYGVRRI